MKRGALQLAIAWLSLALPCWVTMVLVYQSWQSGEYHAPGVCGLYPCGILVVLAMIRFVIPAGAVVAALLLAWRWWKRRWPDRH